jgi:hypothetical protein
VVGQCRNARPSNDKAVVSTLIDERETIGVTGTVASNAELRVSESMQHVHGKMIREFRIDRRQQSEKRA